MYPKRADVETVVRDVGDELLVFECDRHLLHHMNAAAAIVWRLCDGVHSTAQMVDELQDRFDVPRATLASDLDTMLHMLALRGLIVHGE